jgi:RNA polymerase sigma-70 factor (ECF subfamily)
VTATADLEPFLSAACPSSAACPDGLDQRELARRWEIVLPHAERLRRIASRRLASADEADDVVQEAMLRAVTFEHLDAGYAGQFLTSVTVRLCADVHRDRDRQLRVGVRDAVRAVPQNDPHEDVLDIAEARWLYGECLKLPGRERAVMLARARGLSVREAAGHLGVGVKSAEAALTKARHRMRRVVQATGGLLLAFLGKLRRASTPALVSTSMTVLFVGGALHAVSPYDATSIDAKDAPLRSVVGVSVSTPDHSEDAMRGALLRRAAAGSTRLTSRVPRRTPKPDSHVVATTPSIGDPALIGTRKGVSIEQTHENESFTDSLRRCVHGRVSLDPEHFICPTEDLRVGGPTVVQAP